MAKVRLSGVVTQTPRAMAIDQVISTNPLRCFQRPDALYLPTLLLHLWERVKG